MCTSNGFSWNNEVCSEEKGVRPRECENTGWLGWLAAPYSSSSRDFLAFTGTFYLFPVNRDLASSVKWNKIHFKHVRGHFTQTLCERERIYVCVCSFLLNCHRIQIFNVSERLFHIRKVSVLKCYVNRLKLHFIFIFSWDVKTMMKEQNGTATI